jgi:hypothetical protein
VFRTCARALGRREIVAITMANGAIIHDNQLIFIGTTIRPEPSQDRRLYTSSQRWGIRPACLALAALLVSSGSGSADTWNVLKGGWGRYFNERFGTVLEVPLHMFELVEPAPENGDGREFKAQDGSRLSVYGTYAPFAVMSTFEVYKKGLLSEAKDRGLDVTYEKGGKGWLVYSGLTGTNITYTKVIEGCDAAHEFTIEYPASRKAFYDPVVVRLSRTLTCRRTRMP